MRARASEAWRGARGAWTRASPSPRFVVSGEGLGATSQAIPRRNAGGGGCVDLFARLEKLNPSALEPWKKLLFTSSIRGPTIDLEVFLTNEPLFDRVFALPHQVNRTLVSHFEEWTSIDKALTQLASLYSSAAT